MSEPINLTRRCAACGGPTDLRLDQCGAAVCCDCLEADPIAALVAGVDEAVTRALRRRRS